MKERPVLFNTAMVQAVLEDRKFHTRRVIKPQPDEDGLVKEMSTGKYYDTSCREYKCPYGKKDDLLWVRETLKVYDDWNIIYKADIMSYLDYPNMLWKPSIFMPKKYARIWLKIKDIRVEWIQDITEEDALSEGIPIASINKSPVQEFQYLWDSINGKPRKNGVDISWEANPYVWVVEFERIIK